MNATQLDIEATRFARLKPVLDAIHDIIESAGPLGLPSGHLYAMLMPQGIDFNTYNTLVNFMVAKCGIALKNHVLTVTPPVTTESSK